MAASPEYREQAPAAALAPRIACVWTGRLADDGTPFVDRVLPDGCIDLVWDGRTLFVAGPDTGPVRIAPVPRATFAGVRFRPAAAPGFFGVPASVLRDQRVDARELLGSRAPALVEELADSASPSEAARSLERALLGRLPFAAPPDALAEAAAATLGRSPEPNPVAALAGRLGVSQRNLHRRCAAALGYGPKTLHRILRFRRWLALAEQHPGLGLAALAARAGYADQAHLSRDTQRLAGATPAGLLATWHPHAPATRGGTAGAADPFKTPARGRGTTPA